MYPASSVPTGPADSDSGNVELGVRFNVSVPGSVVGLRYYKGATNRGTHTGTLWTSRALVWLQPRSQASGLRMANRQVRIRRHFATRSNACGLISHDDRPLRFPGMGFP